MKRNFRLGLILGVAACLAVGGTVLAGCDKNSNHEHTYKYTVEREATCKQAGLEIGTCEVCGKTKERELPALAHVWETEYTIDVEPTFEAAGSKSIHCKNCDTTKDTQSIPKLNASTNLDYRFLLRRNTGMRLNLAGFSLEIYDGNTRVATGTTNSQGSLTKNLPPREYTVKLTGDMQGYTAEASYTVTAGNPTCYIELTAEGIRDGQIGENTVYREGSILYDFEFTTIDAEPKTVRLSDLLAEKKLVLLNFWATWCVPCASEFPDMLKAYDTYKNDVAVIAFAPNPDNRETETLEAVKAKSAEWGLSAFYVVYEGAHEFYAHFENTANAIPLNVYVDRQGVIAESLASSKDEAYFRSQFKKYTADNYLPDDTPAQTTSLTEVEMILPEKRKY